MEKSGKEWATGTTGTGTLTTGDAHQGYDPDDTQPDETWDQGTYQINGIINGLGRSELQLARGGTNSDQTNSR